MQSTNKYGDKDYGNLRSEVEEFCTYSFPEESLRFYYCYIPWKFIYSIVEDWLAEDQFSGEAPKDGVEFEHWCADRITQQGCTATVSQASGDQGVDVIATRNGTTVAVQCKRYSQPIGNKAIQEAFAGMKHYNANFACVIGSGGFTRAAEELATSTGVTLLDYQMIGDFSERHGFANASKGGSTSVGHNHLIFETPAEKVLSRLFRAAALSYPEEAKLDDNIIRKIMAFTDEDDGSGELTCSRNEFAGLLIFSSLLLCGAFVVLGAKHEDILAMKFPRSNEVANLPNGQEVRFYELLGEELLLEVQAKLRVWCQHLGLNAEAIDTALNIKWSQ